MKQSDDFSYEQIVKRNIDGLSGTVKIHGEAIKEIQRIVDRLLGIQEMINQVDIVRESQIRDLDDKLHNRTMQLIALWFVVLSLTVPHIGNAILWIMEAMT